MSIPPDFGSQFRAIAGLRLERIQSAWDRVLKGMDPKDARVLAHEVHTLKGESQLLGLHDVSLMCHKLEDLLTSARARGYKVDESFDLAVYKAVRFLGILTCMRAGEDEGGVDLPGFLRQIDKVLHAPPGDPVRERTGTPPLELPPELSSEDPLSPVMRARLSLAAADAFIEYAVARGHRRNRLRAAWHILREAVGIRAAVLGPEQLEKHRQAAQAIAIGQGKEIAVHLDVAAIEITTEVFSALDMAILHLVRNAIDHGIEPPSARVAAGKRAAGTIRIGGAIASGSLVVTVADDGRGVQLASVRARAVELGVLEAGEDLRDRWVEILCLPGFSTLAVASDVSGRGVGLDAVRTAITALGGKLDGATTAGGGTTWTMTLPLSPLTVSGHRLRVPHVPFSILLEGWEPANATQAPILLDVAKLLGLDPGETTSGTMSVFGRGANEIALMLTAPAVAATGRRLVAAGPRGLYDVVIVDSREALLLRPERLFND